MTCGFRDHLLPAVLGSILLPGCFFAGSSEPPFDCEGESRDGLLRSVDIGLGEQQEPEHFVGSCAKPGGLLWFLPGDGTTQFLVQSETFEASEVSPIREDTKVWAARIPSTAELGDRVTAVASCGDRCTSYLGTVAIEDPDEAAPWSGTLSLLDESASRFPPQICEPAGLPAGPTISAQLHLDASSSDGLLVDAWTSPVSDLDTGFHNAQAAPLDDVLGDDGSFFVRSYDEGGTKLCARVVDACSGSASNVVCTSGSP